MKRHIGPLVGDGVTLRLLEKGDLSQTREWRNLDSIRHWFFHSTVIAPEQHRAWYDSYVERDDDFVFVIEETRDLHRAVGQIALYNIDWQRGLAEYGRLMIGEPTARGRGIAYRATERLLAEAFGPMHLSEVHLEVMPDNVSACAVYERAGFRATGTTERGATRMVRHL